MTNNVTIIIEGYHGRLDAGFTKIYTEGTTKKRIIKDLKEQFIDSLEFEHNDLNKTISDFEFTIYEDLTEKYS